MLLCGRLLLSCRRVPRKRARSPAPAAATPLLLATSPSPVHRCPTGRRRSDGAVLRRTGRAVCRGAAARGVRAVDAGLAGRHGRHGASAGPGAGAGCVGTWLGCGPCCLLRLLMQGARMGVCCLQEEHHSSRRTWILSQTAGCLLCCWRGTTGPRNGGRAVLGQTGGDCSSDMWHPASWTEAVSPLLPPHATHPRTH